MQDASNKNFYARASAYAPIWLILLTIAVNYVLPPIASICGAKEIVTVPVPSEFIWVAMINAIGVKYIRSIERAGGLPPLSKSNGK